MGNTLALFDGIFLLIDVILCIAMFHIGIMKSAKKNTQYQSCALGIALLFVYSVVIVCFLILLKNDIFPFIEKNTELCLLLSVMIMIFLLMFFISDVSSKSRYTMTQIDKMDGKTFEKACADILSDNGFSKVKITGRSGDGGVDIIAYKGGLKYAVQCKRYRNKLGNSSIQEVFSGKAYYHCDKAVVMTNSYFTKPAIQYAQNLHVELWDRDYFRNQLAIRN